MSLVAIDRSRLFDPLVTREIWGTVHVVKGRRTLRLGCSGKASTAFTHIWGKVHGPRLEYDVR